MRTAVLRFVALIIFAISVGTALADTWNVARLRGQTMQLVGSEWLPLKRGTPVTDERVVRTMANGHMALVRGNETIELGPNTQIAIATKEALNPLRPCISTSGPSQWKRISAIVDDVDVLELAAHTDGEALAGELVDDVEHPVLPYIVGPILDEVVGPDVVGMLGPEPDAGSVIEP